MSGLFSSLLGFLCISALSAQEPRRRDLGKNLANVNNPNYARQRRHRQPRHRPDRFQGPVRAWA